MPKLVFFCGKMAAGKTSASRKIKADLSAILIPEDDWLAKLYPKEIKTFYDYIHYSARLKSVMTDHIRNLMDVAVNIVLDFPANTINQRLWFKDLLQGSGYDHELLYLEADNDVCLQRLRKRRMEQPQRQDFDTEEVFNQVTSYFQAPTLDEGFNINVIKQNTA